MQTVTIDGWEFLCDPDATREAYARVGPLGPDACDCSECRNFVLARSRIYEGEPERVFTQLGITPPREVELICWPSDTDKHQYEGWVHFIGRIKTHAPMEAGMAVLTPPNDPRLFQVWFHERPNLIPETLKGHPVVQLEFRVVVPWLLSEPPSR